MNFIDMALAAKSGDPNAIVDLHKYYLNTAYDYWVHMNANHRYLRKFEEMISMTKIGNTIDYLRIFVYLASLACKKSDQCHKVIIIEDDCDGCKAVSTKTNTDLNYLLAKLDRVILLTNFSGQFTFEEYLKVHYSGYELVGIPAKKSGYDNIIGCPIDFITHDASHLRYVVGNEYISDYLKPIYLRTITLNNERGLLLVIIWMYIHENGFKESFHRKLHPFVYRKKIEFLSTSLSAEFTRYRSVILTNDNINSTISNIRPYLKDYTNEYKILKHYQLSGDYLSDIQANEYILFMLGLNYGYTHCILRA